MLKRILVGLGDEKTSGSAIRYAIELADRFGAELTGISIIDLERLCAVGPQPIGAGGAAQDLENYRLHTAQDMVEAVEGAFHRACGEARVKHTVIEIEGNPFETMAAWSRYHDLTVTAFDRLFEHGVVEEPSDEMLHLVRGGVQPLLGAFGEYRPIERVLIAFSGTIESAQAMKDFVSMGAWPEAHVHIVLFEGETSVVEEAAHYCRAHGLSAEAEVLSGSPITGVLEHAQSIDADLIVAGSSSKSLLRQRLFGDTAMHLTRHADRPLFMS